MRRLKRAMNGECQPDEKTVAVGSAVHAMVSGEFEDRCALMPAFETHAENLTTTGKPSKAKTTTYYKDSVTAFKNDNASKVILSEVQLNTARKAHDRLLSNQTAVEMIQQSELEVTVIGEIEGVLCKTRLDGLVRSGPPRAWDLKTTNDIDPIKLYKSFKSKSYFFQFAFHSLILQNAGDDWVQLQAYDVIALETQDDYDVGVIHILPWDIIDSWEKKVAEVVHNYGLCRRADRWPGLYPLETDVIRVPNWDMTPAETGGVEV